MRILFVVPYVPNLIRVRPYNLIRQLAARDHRLTLMTVWETEKERRDLEELGRYCEEVITVRLSKARAVWNCVRALPTDTPLQAEYSWQPRLPSQVQGLLRGSNGSEKFDVIHVEHLRGSRYGLWLLEHTGGQVPVVWDSVDCISHLFRQAADHSSRLMTRGMIRLELDRTERFEAELVRSFTRVLVTSETDKQALLSLTAGTEPARISVLPNGVDLERFAPPSSADRRQENTLVVSGKMSYHANISMVLHLIEEIMPRVWHVIPEARVWVVGKDPTKELMELDRPPQVEITGTVEDVAPYLRRAALAVAPLTYGAGVQNKVLEAMACATPVVATPRAASTLSVTHNREIALAEGARAFADEIVDLLGDSARRSKLGEAGHRYVVNHHHWSSVAHQLEETYRELIDARS